MNIPNNRLSHWHRDQIVQHIWKRWHIEYLNTLQTRSKWRTPSPPIKTGDLVIIRDDNLHPINWSRGRIVNIYS